MVRTWGSFPARWICRRPFGGIGLKVTAGESLGGTQGPRAVVSFLSGLSGRF
jgi:hypothetical protein